MKMSTASPSLQVHQAALALQPCPAAPVKNSESLEIGANIKVSGHS